MRKRITDRTNARSISAFFSLFSAFSAPQIRRIESHTCIQLFTTTGPLFFSSLSLSSIIYERIPKFQPLSHTPETVSYARRKISRTRFDRSDDGARRYRACAVTEIRKSGERKPESGTPPLHAAPRASTTVGRPPRRGHTRTTSSTIAPRHRTTPSRNENPPRRNFIRHARDDDENTPRAYNFRIRNRIPKYPR